MVRINVAKRNGNRTRRKQGGERTMGMADEQLLTQAGREWVRNTLDMQNDWVIVQAGIYTSGLAGNPITDEQALQMLVQHGEYQGQERTRTAVLAVLAVVKR